MATNLAGPLQDLDVYGTAFTRTGGGIHDVKKSFSSFLCFDDVLRGSRGCWRLLHRSAFPYTVLECPPLLVFDHRALLGERIAPHKDPSIRLEIFMSCPTLWLRHRRPVFSCERAWRQGLWRRRRRAGTAMESLGCWFGKKFRSWEKKLVRVLVHCRAAGWSLASLIAANKAIAPGRGLDKTDR